MPSARLAGGQQRVKAGLGVEGEAVRRGAQLCAGAGSFQGRVTAQPAQG